VAGEPSFDSAAEAPGAPAVNWRGNLLAVGLAMGSGSLGISFVGPFLAIFLHRDLGLHNPRELALWTGIVAGASGLTQALGSPLWGAIADRYGRKTMLLRALVAGGVINALTGLAQNALELTGVRMLLGFSAGFPSASAALIASETPPVSVGWALGVIASTRAFGFAIGPMIGGLLGNFLPLREVFAAGGALLFLSALPVFQLVRETPRPPALRKAANLRRGLAAAPRGTSRAILALVACQGLAQFAYSCAQQLMVLRIIVLLPRAATLGTGIAFAGLGLSTGIAALGYSRLLPWAGYRRLSMAAALLSATSLAVTALAPEMGLLLFGTIGVGLFYGVLNPAFGSMIGLESPPEIKATVFGTGNSAVALGMAGGPIVGGALASVAGVQVGFAAAIVAALISVFVLFRWAREPSASSLQT